MPIAAVIDGHAGCNERQGPSGVGKSMLSMMLQGGGFKVIDLGTNINSFRGIYLFFRGRPDKR